MFDPIRIWWTKQSQRDQRLMLVVAVLAVLLLLKSTVWSGLMAYEKNLNTSLEDMEFQVQLMTEKLAEYPDLREKATKLQERLNSETDLLLPFPNALAAQNHISQKLSQIAARVGLELRDTRPRTPQDVGDYYQRVTIQAKVKAPTQAWVRFLYELESDRLPIQVEQLSLRMGRGRTAHEADVSFQISGLIRRPNLEQNG